MTRAQLARMLHKWLALIVGIQALLWVASGFYMVVVDLDFIHGDPLVRNLTTAPPLQPSSWVPIRTLVARYPGIEHIRVKGLPGLAHALYEVKSGSGIVLVDAVTGTQLSPLPRERVAQLARAYYAGTGALAGLDLLVDDPPLEIRRPLPLWRADFDDGLQTSLYIHPASGELVTRRHRLWRWFDFLFMLHIMDYKERENVNNALLRVATGVGLTLAASGLWLLYFSLRRRARTQS
jgi:uncharacterized iron-regulated membrane protein